MRYAKPQKYKTNPQQPKCVKYWDRVFLNSSIWVHWIVFKEIAEAYLPSIQEDFDCNLRTARSILWNNFIDATCGDQDSPLWDDSGDLFRALTERELAEYMMHLSIGSDINDGMTEKAAIQEYINWLEADPEENGTYEGYRVTTALEIVPVKKGPRKRRRKA